MRIHQLSQKEEFLEKAVISSYESRKWQMHSTRHATKENIIREN
jgi:hypothetical protein